MPSAEYLKNKSGETFYPVVNVSSVIFSDGTTYKEHKTRVSNLVYDAAYKIDNYILPPFKNYRQSAYDSFKAFLMHNGTNNRRFTVLPGNTLVSTPNFRTETGVHGIRYYNGKLQLTLNGEWRDVVNSEDSFKPAKVSKFKVHYGRKVAYDKPNAVGDVYSALNWYDPDDVSASVKWAGTRVYRICHRTGSDYTNFESLTKVFQYAKSLGSKIMEDKYYKNYTVLLSDNRIKNKYSKTKFIDSTLGDFLKTYVDKLNGTLTDNEVVRFSNNTSGFFQVFYLCVPYSEDGFDGTPTIFYYSPITLNITGGSDSVSRYCDFVNNNTYWVGCSYCDSPKTTANLSYWSGEYHQYVEDNLTNRYRCLVDPDGYILGFFTAWNNDFGPDNYGCEYTMEQQALRIQSAESLNSFYPEIYYDQWLPEAEFISGNNNNTESIHNFISPTEDSTKLGPTQDLSWLQTQIDNFTSYPKWSGAPTFCASNSPFVKTSRTLTIPENSIIDSRSELSVNHSFMSVTVPTTLTDGFTVYKWYYDETETGEYKWKSKAKTYAAGETITVDTMVICPLKFYKETIISQGSNSGNIFKVVYSLSNYYEDGYKPHPAFIYERNPGATTIKDSKPTITPYILTSAFPCTVFTGNPIDPVAGARSEPYYKLSTTSPVGDNVTGWDDDTWKTNSKSWSIRSIPNTPVSVMSDPNRIEDLANQKSTDIKWRCIGYAQFALTEMMMLIEYGTTSVKNLLSQHPDTDIYCNTDNNESYAVGAKFDPYIWSFPDVLPQGFVDPIALTPNYAEPVDLGASDVELATKLNRVNINFWGNYDWHNYNKFYYITNTSGTKVLHKVYSKTSSHVIPGATWAMGSFSGFAATVNTFTMSANKQPATEAVNCFVDSSDSTVDCSTFAGIAWNDSGRLDENMPYIVGSYVSSPDESLTYTVTTTILNAHGPGIGSGIGSDSGSTISSPVIGSDEISTGRVVTGGYSVSIEGKFNINSDLSIPGGFALMPVFTYAGEENFGWGNYTPFNSDTAIIRYSLYNNYKYDAIIKAVVSTKYPVTSFDIDKSDPSYDILVSPAYNYYGLIAGFDGNEYYKYFSASDPNLVAYQTLGYFIIKMPTQNQYGKFGWCINHVGLSTDFPEVSLKDELGDSNSILGVTMNARDVKLTDSSVSHSLAACGYDGLAMGIVAHSQSAAIDYSTSSAPYTASTDVTSTAELGNYQPRIYTYAQ